MSIKQHLYRVTKRAVNALPARLLRARAYGVYSVAISDLKLWSLDDDFEHTSWDFRWLSTPGDCQAIAGMVDPKLLRDWNGTSRRAAVAWHTDAESQTKQPVGVAWIAFDTFDEQQLGLSMQLAEQQAWLHSAYVLPEWRNRRIYRALLQFMLLSLLQQGFNQLLLGVSIGNTASLRSHQAVGAIPVGRIVVIRCLGLTLCSTAGDIQSQSRWPITAKQLHRLRVEP